MHPQVMKMGDRGAMGRVIAQFSSELGDAPNDPVPAIPIARAEVAADVQEQAADAAIPAFRHHRRAGLLDDGALGDRIEAQRNGQAVRRVAVRETASSDQAAPLMTERARAVSSGVGNRSSRTQANDTW